MTTVAVAAAVGLVLSGCEPEEAPDAGEPDIRSDDEAAAPVPQVVPDVAETSVAW